MVNKKNESILQNLAPLAYQSLDKKGHIIGTLGSGEDITESKQAEEALQAS